MLCVKDKTMNSSGILTLCLIKLAAVGMFVSAPKCSVAISPKSLPEAGDMPQARREGSLVSLAHCVNFAERASRVSLLLLLAMLSTARAH